MDSGNAATSALIGGSVQFCGSGMEEVLAARSRGQNIVIIENVYRGISAVLVVSKDKAAKMGISPDAPPAERLKALDGTAIATPSATSGFNAPVQAATAKYGAKINFLFIAQPAMVAALESGAISAFMASSPFWEPAVLQNYGTVWLTTPKPGELPEEFVPISVAVLQATEEYARANPEPIAKLRAVFDELAVLIKEQPDAARKLLSQCYPEVDPRSLTLAYDINSDNWTHPNITPADIDHQFKITEAAGVIKGLDKIDRKTIVWPAG
jgi:NitT/TauT family transport system substrate-binding protein